MHLVWRGILLSVSAALVGACAEKRTAADSGMDMYVVSDGMLAIDTAGAVRDGIRILGRDGQAMTGVVPLRFGWSIEQASRGAAVIASSPDALAMLDANRDNRIDAQDPSWASMHLAVDYDGDGNIGRGEYALIGECGVDALQLDPGAGQAWSIHKDGETRLVRLPNAG